jgi:hypothetical protein
MSALETADISLSFRLVSRDIPALLKGNTGVDVVCAQHSLFVTNICLIQTWSSLIVDGVFVRFAVSKFFAPMYGKLFQLHRCYLVMAWTQMCHSCVSHSA